MSLPTLLKPGMLVPHMGENESYLNQLVPADYIVNHIKLLNDKKNNLDISDRVVVILAKTGAGKSTILPVKLYNTFKKKVLVTQPRVITAVEIVKDIVQRKENNLTLYKNIGYQTQEFVRKPQDKGILFSTLGILLQYLKNIDPTIFCKMFKFILIDEAHDNSIDRDLTIYYIKNIINKIPIENLPFFIFMSATLDINEFANYFNTKTIFEVNGKSFPIETHFREPKYNYTDEITNIINEILHSKNNKDSNNIIIFCSSFNMIETINNKIKHKIPNQNVDIIALDSKIYKAIGKEYELLMKKNTKTKIILTTNVAETGLTIPDLTYCIDIGFYISVTYNPIDNSTHIINKVVDQSMATQRKGRVGRQKPGTWYALYSENTYNNMNVFPLAEIYKNNLDYFTLNIISTFENNNNPTNIFDINFINKPAYDSIRNALNKLFVLNFIKYNKHNQNITLTKSGKIAKTLFKISFEHIRIIFASYYYQINMLDIILLISIINNKFTSSYINTDTQCFFINQIIVIKKLLQIKEKIQRKKFCAEFKIDYKSVKQIIMDKYELIKTIAFSIKLDIYKFNTDILELTIHDTEFHDYVSRFKYCMFEGLKLNMLTYNQNTRTYQNRFGNSIQVSSNVLNNKPKYIIVNSIVNNKVKDYVSVLDNFVNIDHTFNTS